MRRKPEAVRLFVVIAAILGAAALCGCLAKTTGAVLTEREFTATEEERARRGMGRPVMSLTGEQRLPEPIAIPAPATPSLTAGPEQPEAREIVASVGAPPERPGTPNPIDQAVIVDAKVGDVNGRPILASEILDNRLGPRLEQLSRESGMTRERWMAESRDLISTQVFLLVRDELIEAEARASLRPEQRQGLQYLLQEWREEERRRSGGARALLEQRLREERGQTVEQWLREREARALIEHHIRQRIDKRAIVTWQDVRNHYERNERVYNPDPVARLRQVRVLSSREEDVVAVQSALERGEPFETVASMPMNTFERAAGGLVVRPIAGEYAQAELFGVPELTSAAQRLSPGEWTREPVRAGMFTYWLKLESIEQVSRPLSDPTVQLEIVSQLSDQKRDEELTRYVRRLMERASFTSLDDMSTRLLQIAANRYGPTR